ncbi:MAG: sensor histidine kinase [Solirubrobacteraceae bacterium]
MRRALTTIVLRHRRPPLAAGIVVGVLGIAAVTALLYPLKHVAPITSLAVLYLLAVLVVSTFWGALPGVATALAAATAFNFFHLPPTGRFTIADDRNWAALVIFLVVALTVSTVAEAARAGEAEAQERRREADLAAEMARLLLGGEALDASLATMARRVAEVLDAPSAAIELGVHEGDGRRRRLALHDGGAQIGALVLPAGLDDEQVERAQRRVVPALESILAAALARERLQAEVVETAALRRSDEMKTAVLRSVSHDLRTPVTSMVAGVQALRSTSLTDAEREQLMADLVDAAERLSRLIDKLLDLARLQAGAADPHRAWCSIDEVLREAIDGVDPAGEVFTTSIDRDLPLVRADAAQLERALANLLENSARYRAGKPVAVRARAVRERLIIRIVDQGPGIPRGEQERVFTPFYRGDHAGPGGSGLGLAIARGFVEANGGRLFVESLPGQGTTFVIELPVEPVAEPAPA